MNQGGGFSAPWILSRIGFSIGGHALTGVGYNLKYNGQMVDNELNSYSQNWGDKGHLYCPLIDLQKDIDDYGAYVVSDLAYIPGQAVKVSLLQQVVNMLTDLLEILQKKSL
jgi:C1A family cysteine protease